MSVIYTCIVIIPPYFDGIWLKNFGDICFQTNLFSNAILLRVTRCFGVKIAFYLYLVIICAIKDMHDCCDAIVHAKRIILIYKT